MSIFSGFSASDEYGRPGGGGGGRRGVGGRAAHHRRQLLAGSSSSSSSSSGYPMTYAEGGGGASGGGLDIEAIADQVVQEMASNPAQFNGIDYGAIIPADAVAQERNRQAAVAEREAAIRLRVNKSSVALRASHADLAAIEEDLFPAEDEGLVTERIFEEGSPYYGGQPRVEMDRIVSLSPSSRGAYPGVSRADLYEAFGGDDDREPEVDAYGFACPVPTRRDRVGSLDADASVLVPSRVPTEFMGRMGLSSTAPRPENLGRYGQDSFGNDRYGEDAPSPFMDSLKVGFGVGLGVAGAFVGLGLVVRALR